jgi:ankyrin repeat protein
VVRAFIDGLFSRSEPSEDVLKQCGNRIHGLCRDGVRILHQAAREGNVHIVEFLLHSAQAAEHTDTISKLLLAEDDGRRTAWHFAAEKGNSVVLQKLLECAKETLTAEELNNKFLFSKDDKEKKSGITNFGGAAYSFRENVGVG